MEHGRRDEHQALPRRHNPNTGERDPAPRRPRDRSGQEDGREDGADLGDPDCSNALGGPREMRITGRLLDKYGYTDGCLGCAHKQAGLYDHRQHSTTTTAVPESDFSSLSITGKGPPPAPCDPARPGLPSVRHCWSNSSRSPTARQGPDLDAAQQLPQYRNQFKRASGPWMWLRASRPW